ncbi:hypothetical protein ACFOX0_17970 [Micromonospora zhanjiangensis]|uniref:Uncharacterized protein n=1 Tax=Micromonospora zhanjiangensis TaxID=1522057 RepID=A0ABV8KNV2_9ACTN
MADVIELFPGAGIPPAPGPRVDLDGVTTRRAALVEARRTGPTSLIARCAEASADDVPDLMAEIAYKEQLRQELADEVTRLTELVGEYRLTDAAVDVLDWPAR